MKILFALMIVSCCWLIPNVKQHCVVSLDRADSFRLVKNTFSVAISATSKGYFDWAKFPTIILPEGFHQLWSGATPYTDVSSYQPLQHGFQYIDVSKGWGGGLPYNNRGFLNGNFLDSQLPFWKAYNSHLYPFPDFLFDKQAKIAYFNPFYTPEELKNAIRKTTPSDVKFYMTDFENETWDIRKVGDGVANLVYEHPNLAQKDIDFDGKVTDNDDKLHFIYCYLPVQLHNQWKNTSSEAFSLAYKQARNSTYAGILAAIQQQNKQPKVVIKGQMVPSSPLDMGIIYEDDAYYNKFSANNVYTTPFQNNFVTGYMADYTDYDIGGTYFRYDWRQAIQGNYLSNYVRSLESLVLYNRSIGSKKPVYSIDWLFYSQGCYEGICIAPQEAEAMAIFSYFAGAKGRALWDNVQFINDALQNPPNSTPPKMLDSWSNRNSLNPSKGDRMFLTENCGKEFIFNGKDWLPNYDFVAYEHFLKGLSKVFSPEYVQKIWNQPYHCLLHETEISLDGENFVKLLPKNIEKKQLPMVRAVVTDAGNILVAATNSYARSANDILKIVVRYKNWTDTITLKGTEVFIGLGRWK